MLFSIDTLLETQNDPSINKEDYKNYEKHATYETIFEYSLKVLSRENSLFYKKITYGTVTVDDLISMVSRFIDNIEYIRNVFAERAASLISENKFSVEEIMLLKNYDQDLFFTNDRFINISNVRYFDKYSLLSNTISKMTNIITNAIEEIKKLSSIDKIMNVFELSEKEITSISNLDNIRASFLDINTPITKDNFLSKIYNYYTYKNDSDIIKPEIIRSIVYDEYIEPKYDIIGNREINRFIQSLSDLYNYLVDHYNISNNYFKNILTDQNIKTIDLRMNGYNLYLGNKILELMEFSLMILSIRYDMKISKIKKDNSILLSALNKMEKEDIS